MADVIWIFDLINIPPQYSNLYNWSSSGGVGGGGGSGGSGGG